MAGFRQFVLRGNVIDLAVAVVIGAALVAVVTAIVEGIINPMIGAAFNAASLGEALNVEIGDATLKFGLVLAALINFVLVALIVYFALVRPITKLRDRFAPEEVDEAAGPSEVELLADIRDLLRALTGRSSHAAPEG